MSPRELHRPGGAAAGFSLLEVLIAILVLTLGATGVLALFAEAASTHRRSIDRTEAALLAERVVAHARVLYSHGLALEDLRTSVLDAAPVEGGGYAYDLALVRPEGDAWRSGETLVEVRVRWKEGGFDRAESFQTLILPRAPPGGTPPLEARSRSSGPRLSPSRGGPSTPRPRARR